MFGGGSLRDRPRDLDWRSKRDRGGPLDPWRAVIRTLITLVVLLVALAVFVLLSPEREPGPGEADPRFGEPEVQRRIEQRALVRLDW